MKIFKDLTKLEVVLILIAAVVVGSVVIFNLTYPYRFPVNPTPTPTPIIVTVGASEATAETTSTSEATLEPAPILSASAGPSDVTIIANGKSTFVKINAWTTHMQFNSDCTKMYYSPGDDYVPHEIDIPSGRDISVSALKTYGLAHSEELSPDGKQLAWLFSDPKHHSDVLVGSLMVMTLGKTTSGFPDGTYPDVISYRWSKTGGLAVETAVGQYSTINFSEEPAFVVPISADSWKTYTGSVDLNYEVSKVVQDPLTSFILSMTVNCYTAGNHP